MNLYKSLGAINPQGGFKMDGYHIDGASVIKGDDEKYYLFASRKAKTTEAEQENQNNSEIVLATSLVPEGPYEFKKVVINEQNGVYFPHTPHIKKFGDTYVLFFTASRNENGKSMVIGYATSKDLVDFQIANDFLDLPQNSLSPSACILRDGKVLLVFCDQENKVSVAKADNLNDGFRLLAYDVFDGKKASNMFIFNYQSRLHIIAGDCEGAFTGELKSGFHVTSTDGINWEKADAVKAYDSALEFSDGTKKDADLRTSPQLLFNSSGKPSHLFTSVLCSGESFVAVQPVMEE